MVFRSQTTGGDGFNEISFEDKPGREQMFIQSQREKVELIGNRSMTIQTTSLGAAGVAETAAMGAATTAMSFLFMGLVPFAMPSTISANTEVTQAATELLNKRR